MEGIKKDWCLDTRSVSVLRADFIPGGSDVLLRHRMAADLGEIH